MRRLARTTIEMRVSARRAAAEPRVGDRESTRALAGGARSMPPSPELPAGRKDQSMAQITAWHIGRREGRTHCTPPGARSSASNRVRSRVWATGSRAARSTFVDPSPAGTRVPNRAASDARRDPAAKRVMTRDAQCRCSSLPRAPASHAVLRPAARYLGQGPGRYRFSRLS